MGHWEDFWYETHRQLDELNLRAEFDAQLEKMTYQDKHRYKDARERWSYALAKVLKHHRGNKSKINVK